MGRLGLCMKASQSMHFLFNFLFSLIYNLYLLVDMGFAVLIVFDFPFDYIVYLIEVSS